MLRYFQSIARKNKLLTGALQKMDIRPANRIEFKKINSIESIDQGMKFLALAITAVTTQVRKYKFLNKR